MKIALVSRDNGVGLSTDVQLLHEWLTDAGHNAEFVDWRRQSMKRCDVAISLELVNPMLMRYARANVGVFNLEWFVPAWKRHLSRFNQVWVKSLESQRIYDELSVPSVYTGFLGRNMYDPTVTKERTCLHVRGRSSLKGTEHVLEAWQRHPDLPPLTIVSHAPLDALPGVQVLSRLELSELKHEMNAHAIHVCPSISEGWGHYIVEGLSTGAYVVTTDASPMNEHVRHPWGAVVSATDGDKRHLATDHRVAADDLADKIRIAATLPESDFITVGALAREHFNKRNTEFRAQAVELLNQLAHQPLPRPREAPHHTPQVHAKYSSVQPRQRGVRARRDGAA